jgi:two-component system nitrogen regulation response regulator NtrX|tara:strand:- start:108108 stop:109583 length:1476 start_codon:yes stop_codon:yes gene_type:complete
MSKPMPTILIVDDEPDIRALVGGILEDEGYNVCYAETHQETFVQIESERPDMVLLDIWLENSAKDGLGILTDIQELSRDVALPVVMMSGHGNIETAVKALQIGAFDFIEKPFKTERLLLLVSRAIELSSLKRENKALKTSGQRKEERHLVGRSNAAEGLRQIITRVAPTNSRILLTGEAGVGKDFIGRLIHESSEREDMPFMAVNCGSMHADKFDIELFGCLAGVQGEPERVGLFERCNGGTFFLDEVGDMPFETQGKLVRVLQEQRFERLGSTKPISLDIRVVASTSYDLNEKIQSGAFRQDLYYRLNVVSVQVPSLKDRKEDVELLCAEFSRELCNKSDLETFSFSVSAMSALKSYAWPGNMRQLRNVIEWLTIMKSSTGKTIIEPDDLPPEILSVLPKSIVVERHADFLDMNLKDARANFERDYLSAQLQRFSGNITKAAEAIGMERSALHRKIKSLEINTQDTAEALDSTAQIGEDGVANKSYKKTG